MPSNVCGGCGKKLGGIKYFMHREAFCSYGCLNKKFGPHILDITSRGL